MADHPINRVRKLSPKRRIFLRKRADALLNEGKTVSAAINVMVADTLCSRALASAIMRYVKAYRNYTCNDKAPPQPVDKEAPAAIELLPATLG